MAGRMTLSGRVVSSERGGRGIPSWWMLVGTNTGGNTGGEGCVCGGGRGNTVHSEILLSHTHVLLLYICVASQNKHEREIFQ